MTARLLASAQPASAQAIRAAHGGQLPDAFAMTRRYLRETRLSGHLADERDALELFGDVLLAAGRPAVAVAAWMTGGIADKAADVAGHATAPLDACPWANSPARACQAAAAQVIGAQAWLYGPDGAEEPVHQLLGLTRGLWTTLRIAPNPPVDAVKALSRFGMDLPASAVDPVLGLIRPHAAAGGALTPETARAPRSSSTGRSRPGARTSPQSSDSSSAAMARRRACGTWLRTSPSKPGAS